MEPRVKKQKQTPPPYELNKLPEGFSEQLAKKIIALLAKKSKFSITGTEWEQIFASCVGATWQSSNVGLRDVYKDTCCWSAKTVEGYVKLPSQKSVRLICGRNNTGFSFNIDITGTSDPQEVGRNVLDIWNARVNDARQEYKYIRQVILVRSKTYTEYFVFEKDVTTYDADDYVFSWNKNKNVVGFRKSDNKHVFTWQKEGKQFTIIEDIPAEKIHIRLKQLPAPIIDEKILAIVGYTDENKEEWFEI